MLSKLSVIFRLAVGLAALAIAGLVFYAMVETKPEPTRATALEAPPVVETLRVRRVDVPIEWTGYGTARPLDAADIASEVQGRVIERPESVEDGEPIAEGDLIVALDPTVYGGRVESLERQIEEVRANIDSLEIEEASLREQVALTEEQVAAARRDLERARDALAQGAGNESQVDARIQTLQRELVTLESLRQRLSDVPARREALRARLATRRADLRVAQHDLDQTRITSPLSGVLQSVEAEVGEYLSPGEPVARVVDLSRIEVPVRLPASAAGTVARGDAVELRPDGPSSAVWRGEVVRIAPEADEARRTVTVFVEIDQTERGDQPDDAPVLQPGRFVSARVTTDEMEPRLVAPRRVVDVDRVLIAEPITPRSAREDTSDDPRFTRIDVEAADRLMRVREVDVNVERYVEARFPGLDPRETQWAILSDRGVAPSRALRAGDYMVLSRGERIRPDTLIDAREPATPASTARNGGSS